MWFRKGLEFDRTSGNSIGLKVDLNNLAGLLRELPGRLVEARQYAEEALEIAKTLDPAAAEIWRSYKTLSDIASREASACGDPTQKAELDAKAREYHRLARHAKRDFPGTRHELRKHVDKIYGTILALNNPAHRDAFEEALSDLERRGWTSLVSVIRRTCAGERDADVLCADLDLDDSMIVEAILDGLADPSTLSELLPPEGSA